MRSIYIRKLLGRAMLFLFFEEILCIYLWVVGNFRSYLDDTLFFLLRWATYFGVAAACFAVYAIIASAALGTGYFIRHRPRSAFARVFALPLFAIIGALALAFAAIVALFLVLTQGNLT
jgi:hypothetical protein